MNKTIDISNPIEFEKFINEFNEHHEDTDIIMLKGKIQNHNIPNRNNDVFIFPSARNKLKWIIENEM